MVYKPIEPPAKLLLMLCKYIGEDMKYILSEICDHNSYYPRHKISIDYVDGDDFACLFDSDGELIPFGRIITGGFDKNFIVGAIRGYSAGLGAAGVRSRTPKNL